MRDVHPFLEAVLKAECERLGMPVDLMRARIEQRVPTPRALAEFLRMELGIPIDAWWLEDESVWQQQPASLAKPARRLRSKMAVQAQSDSTVADARPQEPAHVPRNLAIARGMRASGRNANHPFMLWLTSAGLTVDDWAKKHDLKRARVQSWMGKGKARRRCPDGMRQTIEKESAGAVPSPAWGD